MAKRRRSALVELKRLEAAFAKNRSEIIQRAKDEAVGAVGNIVKQLQTFAHDFPDIVANAVSHLANAAESPKAKLGRPPSAAATKSPKAKRANPTRASGAQVKAVLGALSKTAVNNKHLSEATKLSPGIVSVALRQLRDDGQATSHGKGRATTWTATAK